MLCWYIKMRVLTLYFCEKKNSCRFKKMTYIFIRWISLAFCHNILGDNRKPYIVTSSLFFLLCSVFVSVISLQPFYFQGVPYWRVKQSNVIQSKITLIL